jgi:hypothetical protein
MVFATVNVFDGNSEFANFWLELVLMGIGEVTWWSTSRMKDFPIPSCPSSLMPQTIRSVQLSSSLPGLVRDWLMSALGLNYF